MSESSLIGKAKELYVATLLVDRKLHVYFPLVDNGFDLVVSKRDGSDFIPVQVKYKAVRSGFTLDRDDARKFADADAVLAFGSGSELDVRQFYFIPAREWLALAQNQDTQRGDNKLVVYLTQSSEWAKKFCGREGIETAFGRLLAQDSDELISPKSRCA